MTGWLHTLGIDGKFSLFGHGLVLVIINSLLLLVIIYLLSIPVLFLINLYKLLKRDTVTLILTPPGFKETKVESFEKLLTGIYGLNSSPSFMDRLLRSRNSLSLEVSASEANGLKFMMVLPKDQQDNVRKVVKSALPGTHVEIANVSLEFVSEYRAYKAMAFKFKKPFYLSLKTNEESSLAYQPALLALEDREELRLQMTIIPLPSRFNTKAIKRLKNKKTKRAGWLVKLVLIPLYLLRLLSKIKRSNVAKNVDTKDKLASPLFKASMRLVVIGESTSQVNSRTKSFKSSLVALSTPGSQSLVVRLLPKEITLLSYKNQLPSLVSSSLILSTGELASLYHFPLNTDAGTEDLAKSLSRTLPLSLQSRSTKTNVAMGETNFDGQTSLIGLSEDERARHLYIIGGTGNGKTTMIEYMATQDMKNGKGIMVIDPHGDLAVNLLKRIPKNRIKDVIYFNPSDVYFPVGLNLLELPKGLSPRELAVEKDRITESVISVFRKTFNASDESNAFRIERLLRNSIHTALTVDNATLFTVSRILSDKYYRWEVIQDLKDASLKRFWLEEFNKAGDYQRVKMSLGPLSRLERFERNLYVKNIVNQKTSGFNFDNVISSKKILICNLSKGAISEDASNLLGSLLLAKLQLAALRRQSIKASKRTPFYVYVDEFQNYANPSFVAMLSEARKYGLRLTLAQQSPSQLTDRSILDVIMDNVGSLVAFRSKSVSSERLILSQFEPYITKGEIGNLPRYCFYAKVSSTEPKEPVSGRTVLLKYQKVDLSNRVINSSRHLYVRSVDSNINALPA